MIERITELFEKDNKSVNAILTELKLNKSAFSEWKSGKTKPTLDAIIKLANFFNVSTDWLLTGKDKVQWQPSEIDKLYNQLKAQRDKDQAKKYIGFLLEEQAKTEKQKNINVG